MRRVLIDRGLPTLVHLADDGSEIERWAMTASGVVYRKVAGGDWLRAQFPIPVRVMDALQGAMRSGR